MSSPGFQSSSERGSALLAALFLIVVVAALGAFAVRIGSDQQQTATLQLLQYRAVAAADAGLEVLAYLAASTFPAPMACPAPAAPIVISDFDVTLNCFRSDLEADDRVYVLTATATIRTAAYGSPDFVRRTRTRTVKSFPDTGRWSGI